MDRYHLWFHLKDGVKDLDLADSIKAMMEHMIAEGTIEGYQLERCKLGFRPAEIGEWHVAIETRDMAQLQAAFDSVTPRTGEVERLHAMVWSKVRDVKFGLYRDFPDANRT